MRAMATVIALLAAPTWAQTPVVVTDIAPVHSLAAQVMGDLGQPRLLLDPASDPHHFQMRPSQARIVADADLMVWMGPALTPWLERSLATMAPDARSLPLLDLAAAPLRIENKDADGHDHGSLDPHAWLDPLNAAAYLRRIAEDLAVLDPANAAIYAANARVAAENLERHRATLAPIVAQAGDATLIATHDAFGYFLTRYGLSLGGSLSDSAGNAPGVAGLSALQQGIADAGKPVCVLQEPGVSAKSLLNLDPSVPVKVVELDPMGRDHPLGPELYVAMLGDLADALATCADATE